jgi:hypothetical protein
MELLLEAMRIDGFEATVSALINKNIVYLDKVLDTIWKEVLKAGNSVTANWRSETLDEWLIIEFVVGRHDHDHINALENIEELQQDVLDLGKYILFYNLLTILIYHHIDWNEYENRTDYIITGDQYGFDIKNLSVDPDMIYRFIAIWLEDTSITSQQIPGLSKGMVIL